MPFLVYCPVYLFCFVFPSFSILKFLNVRERVPQLCREEHRIQDSVFRLSAKKLISTQREPRETEAVGRAAGLHPESSCQLSTGHRLSYKEELRGALLLRGAQEHNHKWEPKLKTQSKGDCPGHSQGCPRRTSASWSRRDYKSRGTTFNHYTEWGKVSM